MVKPRLVERKGLWLIAASLIDPRPVPIVLDGEPVNPPVYRASEPYREWVLDFTVDATSWRHAVVKVKTSGSGLVRVDGETYVGLDNAHTYFIVPGGGVRRIQAVLTPPTIHGAHWGGLRIEYILASGVVLEAFRAGLRLLAVYDYVASLPRGWLRDEVLKALGEVLAGVRIRATIPQLVATSLLIYDSNWSPWTPRKELPPPRFDAYMMMGLHGLPPLGIDSEEPPGPGEVGELARQLWDTIEDALLRIRRRVRVDGVIHAIAHSHIDTAWLWPVEEGVRKVLRTNATIVYLSGLGDIVYGQSPALHHKWLSVDEDLYRRVGGLIEGGRWIPLGGFLVEGDLQLVHGESIARQLLYGQMHYESGAGGRAVIGWLPDNFGYPASLPQLLRDAGLRVLVIQKVLWNDTTRFPYYAFKWRGLDGTEIPVQVIPDNVYAYNAPARPSHIKRYWEEYNGASKRLVYPYGYGDGGGGPTLEMVESLKAAEVLPGLPDIVHGGLEDLAEDLENSDLPVYEGELYLELHRGAYTTNQEVKRLVYEAERALRTLDFIQAVKLAEGAGVKDSRGLWEVLLVAEFHDILPGTATREAVQGVMERLRSVVEEASRTLDEDLEQLTGCRSYVANPNPWRIGFVAEAAGRVDGCQDFMGKCLVWVDAPPLSVSTPRITEPGDEAYAFEEDGYVVLGNGYIRARIGPGGVVEDLTYKGARMLDWGNRYEAHIDEPPEWDAWDVERESLETYRRPMEGRVEVVARGPLRACASARSSWSGIGSIDALVCIDAGSQSLDVRARIDWRSRGVLARAWFKPSIKGRYYFEAPFGWVERGVSELEGPKYESPMQRWVSVNDGARGLILYSPQLHGVAYRRGELGLTLVKRPYFPNPWTDQGGVAVEYSVIPYNGGVEDLPTHIIYSKWGKPHAVVRGGCGREVLKRITMIDPPLPVSTVKPWERGRGVVVRLYNNTRRTVETRIAWEGEVYRGNILEEPGDRVMGEITVKPFEVYTLILKL
ncbi:MAG: glycosyl hydrolase-related protein [Desulfurococcales archaeon]|nr:glycosyl hydrolase-related protein [Desulfurococcales archaeon]